MRNKMSRLFAVLLAAIMLLNVLPLSAMATETDPLQTADPLQSSDLLQADSALYTDSLIEDSGTTTYVLAGSDFQPTDYKTSTGVSLVNDILDEVYGAGYTYFDGFLFAGDYDYGYSASTAGKQALQGAVKTMYPGIAHEVYVEGNHDSASRQGIDLVANGTLSPSGENDAEDYGVFVINERDYMWASTGIKEETIQNTANNLKEYLDAKRDEGYTKPIFVVSHLALNYSMRTKNDGDGMYANYIFDVLNEAGEAGLNIIFLFGHNHSNGWDDYLGGSSVYLEKGDSILIAQGSKTVFKEETLAFTYMNAGYVAYYRNVNTGSETDLTMTVFEITDDTVTINRFSDDGLHDMKSTGVRNSYKNETAYDPNTEVYVSPQTVTLNKTVTGTDGEVVPPAGGDNTGSGDNTDPDDNTGSGTVGSIEQVTALEQGVPYIIVSDRNGLVLTSKATTNKDGHDALLLDGEPSVDTTDVWYYNGTNLIYGDPDSTSTYLLMSTDTAYLGETHSYRMVDNIYLNDDGTTFTLKRTDDNLYLNQYGGGSYTAASPYTSDGNSDAGSKWRFYKVIPGSTEPLPDTVSITKDGVTVTAPGITDLTVSSETKEVYGYTAYVSYDIAPADYTQGHEATVAIELDMTLFDTSRPVVIIDPVLGTRAYRNIVDGTVSFTTNHFSPYDVAQTAAGDVEIEEWVTITEPTDSAKRYVYELDTDGIDTGVEYLIVANSYAKALSAGASSNNAVDITISGNYAYATSDTYGWTFTRYSYSNGVYYIQLDGSTYLRYNSGSLSSSSTLGSKNNQQNERRWTITNNTNGSYKIVSVRDSDYELRWSNSNGVFQLSNSNEGPVRLYKYSKEETIGAQPGLYAAIVGADTYDVPVGATAEQALAIVKAGIDIYYTTDSTATTGTPYDDDGQDMTWTLAGNYDGTKAGEYDVTIAYDDITLGTVKVKVPTAKITGYSIDPAVGSVSRGAAATAQTGAFITVHLEDGSSYQVPVTVGMLTGANGSAVSTDEITTINKLILTYNNVTITDNFTLHVQAKAGNNYPEYPNEGAVQVNKTSTGVDFQSSGIAQVEVSASGVPVQKGADVIVMVDLSSSMNSNKITENGVEKTRLQVLREAMTVLLTQLQSNDAEGNPMDIRIAVADFNRYYTDSSSPYYINSADHMVGGSIRTNVTGTNKAYTNTTGRLDASAFVDVHSIATRAFETTSTTNQYYLGYQSGTNYDYAFDAIYQLGDAITTQNATEGEDRDLFVIFMSDGAPFQYNYYSEQSDSNGAPAWNDWLQGTATESQMAGNKTYYNEDGKHWMAEAIKGDPASTYPVIRKNDPRDTNGDNWIDVRGLGATMYSIGFCLAVDKSITVTSMDTVIRNIATSEQYYHRADTATALNTAFSQIGRDIAYAANKARFVDQMGTNFNLHMTTNTYTVVVDNNGTPDVPTDDTTETRTHTPFIEILSYDIYTKAEADAGQIPAGKNIGDRKGTSTLLEVIKFSDDGKQAYSSKIDVDKDGTFGVTVNADGSYTITDRDDNIMGDDKVIYAMTFLYNGSDSPIAVDGISIPTGIDSTTNLTTGSTNKLPAETFYWKMGTVQTSELAMRYFVYLDGSMTGTRPAGSYATNEFATLYYDNYLGNPAYKDTVSPVMAWQAANVSYAFYLVNENGEIIVNQTTGQTGSFANKIAVTNPVVYEEIMLNNTDQVQAIDVKAISDDVLPKYYTLYDEDAVYTVTINSNSTGNWEIEKGNVSADSTYVTNFGGGTQTYSNALVQNAIGLDYTHTVVWFAVVWSVQAHPDSVVVDYGLPVDISVLSNDMFGDNGKLNSVGPVANANLVSFDAQLAENFGESQSCNFGTAKADPATGTVRYTLNTMEVNGYDQFAYAVHYTGAKNAGYYYDTVTVIPATTVYYEDGFLTYFGGWGPVGEYDSSKTQDEDRPGRYSLNDFNNIYGFDHVNEGMSTYSLGSAMKVHVAGEAYATAEFTFYGTGFDVIGMTSNTTGVLSVKVEAAEDVVSNGAPVYTAGQKVCATAVDTYYGYKSEEHVIKYVYNNGKWEVSQDLGLPANYTDNIQTSAPADAKAGDTYIGLGQVWVVTPDVANALYQIPVIQIEDLPYGKYTVLLTATYHELLDHTSTENTDETPDGYDLYLDAIRIYDPTNNGAADGSEDKTIENAYQADGEGWPTYLELRNNVISVGSFDNTSTSTEVEGLVFIDGDASVGSAQMADYTSYGPNNELYLASGQQVAFTLDLPENIAAVHLGMKSANGQACTYVIKNIAKTGDAEHNITAGQVHNVKRDVIDTTTDMYYDVTDWRHDIIVIENVGPGILSLTNIKFTYKSNPDATGSDSNSTGENSRGTLSMTPYRTKLTLKTLNAAAVIPDVEEPVVEGPVIVSQPVSYEGNVGDKVDFTVVAEGEGLSYQWYYKAAGSEDWLKSYSTGSTTATLSVELRAYRDGQEYRCMVTDINGETVVSDAASMTLKACDIVITVQPADYEGAMGDMATFTVEVAGDNLSYRWQYSNDGGETWQNSWSDGYSTETLTVEMRAYRIGQLYRCVISNTAGEEVISDAATLVQKTSVIEILAQPENVTCTAGETVKFNVHAAGEGLKYRWYRSADGETWTMTWLTGYNTAELSFLANTSRAGYAYKCVITDADGNTLETNAVSCVLN